MTVTFFDEWELAGLARRMLCIDEGIRPNAYRDTKGYLTIGIGRNLNAKPLSNDSMRLMLDEDIEEARTACLRIFGIEWFNAQTANRQLALINLAFNLGENTFRSFKETIALMKADKWDEAADRLLTLPYAKQVGKRAERVATMLKDKDFPYITYVPLDR